MRYRIVDVFSNRPLAGNALCVVVDECPEELMAAIAREVNLSETTFPRRTGCASYTMRIFTPAREPLRRASLPRYRLGAWPRTL